MGSVEFTLISVAILYLCIVSGPYGRDGATVLTGQCVNDGQSVEPGTHPLSIAGLPIRYTRILWSAKHRFVGVVLRVFLRAFLNTVLASTKASTCCWNHSRFVCAVEQILKQVQYRKQKLEHLQQHKQKLERLQQHKQYFERLQRHKQILEHL